MKIYVLFLAAFLLLGVKAGDGNLATVNEAGETDMKKDYNTFSNLFDMFKSAPADVEKTGQIEEENKDNKVGKEGKEEKELKEIAERQQQQIRSIFKAMNNQKIQKGTPQKTDQKKENSDQLAGIPYEALLPRKNTKRNHHPEDFGAGEKRAGKSNNFVILNKFLKEMEDKEDQQNLKWQNSVFQDKKKGEVLPNFKIFGQKQTGKKHKQYVDKDQIQFLLKNRIPFFEEGRIISMHTVQYKKGLYLKIQFLKTEQKTSSQRIYEIKARYRSRINSLEIISLKEKMSPFKNNRAKQEEQIVINQEQISFPSSNDRDEGNVDFQDKNEQQDLPDEKIETPQFEEESIKAVQTPDKSSLQDKSDKQLPVNKVIPQSTKSDKVTLDNQSQNIKPILHQTITPERQDPKKSLKKEQPIPLDVALVPPKLQTQQPIQVQPQITKQTTNIISENKFDEKMQAEMQQIKDKVLLNDPLKIKEQAVSKPEEIPEKINQKSQKKVADGAEDLLISDESQKPEQPQQSSKLLQQEDGKVQAAIIPEQQQKQVLQQSGQENVEKPALAKVPQKKAETAQFNQPQLVQQALTINKAEKVVEKPEIQTKESLKSKQIVPVTSEIQREQVVNKDDQMKVATGTEKPQLTVQQSDAKPTQKPKKKKNKKSKKTKKSKKSKKTNQAIEPQKLDKEPTKAQ